MLIKKQIGWTWVEAEKYSFLTPVMFETEVTRLIENAYTSLLDSAYWKVNFLKFLGEASPRNCIEQLFKKVKHLLLENYSKD